MTLSERVKQTVRPIQRVNHYADSIELTAGHFPAANVTSICRLTFNMFQRHSFLALYIMRFDIKWSSRNLLLRDFGIAEFKADR